MLTPKQKYDERKRLRLENDLRSEEKRRDDFDRGDRIDASILRFVAAFERIADVMELWADQQEAGRSALSHTEGSAEQ